ncbi:hypothetical protein [Kribbella sp. NPDC050459]|uniref:hypothetical protein n=1 Tax=Kribbella sp. NPDC050459 TaxID=3155785 RepID=UPI0033F5A534
MKSGGDSSRHSRDDISGRSRPDEPTNWRDIVRADYEYPEEIGELSRKERRQAKRTWRRDDHAQRVAWLRQQRQTEPTSPVTVVVAVVILAIVVLGLGGGLPRLLRGDEPTSGGVGVLTPSPPPGQAQTPAASQSTTTPAGPTTLQNSTPPILTARPAPTATTAATTTVNAWARVFYTRDPSRETYADLIDKTAAYITTQLGDNLQTEGDSTYEALKSDGGKSTVANVKVEMPRPDAAPVDTPTRISRMVSVTIEVTGKRPNRMVLPLLVTLVPEGTGWVISDLNGGTGP